MAVGAITAAAAFSGGTPAIAAKAKASHMPRGARPTKVLRRQAENRINHRRPMEVYDGTLTFPRRLQDPVTHRWTTVMTNILNPLVVFRGNPKAETPRDPVASGDYDLGSVTDKMGHAVVNLFHYDPRTMTLTPASKAPNVVEGILEEGQGSSFELTDPEGQGTPILLDPSGNPERVAYEYTPQK